MDVRVAGISIDCADPQLLGRFYLDLLRGEQLWDTAGSVGVRVSGGVVLVPQRVDDYRPPRWPDASVVHLDIAAGPDLAATVARAVSLGATEAQLQPDPRWRILLDPAGHPFCVTTIVPD